MKIWMTQSEALDNLNSSLAVCAALVGGWSRQFVAHFHLKLSSILNFSNNSSKKLDHLVFFVIWSSF